MCCKSSVLHCARAWWLQFPGVKREQVLNVLHQSVGVLVDCFQFVRCLLIGKKGKLTCVIVLVRQYKSCELCCLLALTSHSVTFLGISWGKRFCLIDNPLSVNFGWKNKYVMCTVSCTGSNLGWHFGDLLASVIKTSRRFLLVTVKAANLTSKGENSLIPCFQLLASACRWGTK